MRLIKGLQLPTLDPQPLGDIKRMARVPFSIHEKTSSICSPVDLELKPYTPENLDAYRTLDVELLKPIVKQLKAEEKLKTVQAKTLKGNANEKIRPCIQTALNQPLNGENGHLMRLAVAREYLAAGYTLDDVVQLFIGQADFNIKKTRYYVEYAKKNPARHFKCQTIRNLGFCLREACPSYRAKFKANDSFSSKSYATVRMSILK